MVKEEASIVAGSFAGAICPGVAVCFIEGDDGGHDPFIDSVLELPLGSSVLFPLPIGESLSEGSGEVDPEAGGEVAPFVDKAELPACGDEIGEQVVSVIRPELDPAAADHLRADCFHVLQLV